MTISVNEQMYVLHGRNDNAICKDCKHRDSKTGICSIARAKVYAYYAACHKFDESKEIK